VNSVLNVSAYRFVPIADPAALRESLLQRARSLGLKGTILLASEGINLFLAGAPDAVRGFVASLQLEAKESWSASQPFRKLLVKVKREIIRMNHPAIQPAQGRAPALDAATAKRWRQSAAPLRIMNARAAAGVVTDSEARDSTAMSSSSSSPARMPAVELTICACSTRPSQYGLPRWNGAQND
jgi:acylphosphatase